MNLKKTSIKSNRYFIGIGILTLYTTYTEKSCFAAAKQTSTEGKANVWRCSSKQKS